MFTLHKCYVTHAAPVTFLSLYFFLTPEHIWSISKEISWVVLVRELTSCKCPQGGSLKKRTHYEIPQNLPLIRVRRSVSQIGNKCWWQTVISYSAGNKFPQHLHSKKKYTRLNSPCSVKLYKKNTCYSICYSILWPILLSRFKD